MSQTLRFLFLWIPLAFCALVLAVVAAELLARRYIRRSGVFRIWAPFTRREMLLDTEVVPRLRAKVGHFVNSIGERGDEPPGDDEPGIYRILAVGGSAVDCYLLDQDDTWTSQLQSLLRLPANRDRLGASGVHVGNLGRSGVDAVSLDTLLKRVLPLYKKLDLVVVMVGASCVLNWLSAGAPLVPKYEPIPLDQIFQWNPDEAFSWRVSRTALAKLICRLRQLWLRPVIRRTDVGKSLRHARKVRSGATDIRSNIPDPTGMLDLFDRGMRSALTQARDKVGSVLVARQPWFEKESYTAEEEAQFWNGAVGDPYKEEVHTFFSIGAVCKLMGLLDARLVSLCDELEISHIDLRQAVEPSVQNYYDQFHFAPEGASIVARHLAEAVIEEKSRLRCLAMEPESSVTGK